MDAIIEADGLGTETLNLEGVTAGASVTIDGSIVVLSGDNQIFNGSGSLEVILGTAATDAFSVVPSATTAYALFGGAGTGTDVLSYDAGGLLTTQTDTAITSTGRQAVVIDGFETIEVLNAASVALAAPAPPGVAEPTDHRIAQAVGTRPPPSRGGHRGKRRSWENLNQEVLLAVARPEFGQAHWRDAMISPNPIVPGPCHPVPLSRILRRGFAAIGLLFVLHSVALHGQVISRFTISDITNRAIPQGHQHRSYSIHRCRTGHSFKPLSVSRRPVRMRAW